MSTAVLQVHDTTVPHLDFIEKILLDELVRQGRAVIVSSASGQTVGGFERNGAGTDN